MPHRDWKKMVEQEVIYLIRNDEYSELVTTDLLQNITFVGFFKSKSQKVGVEFQVHLNEPHWDNPQRIGNSKFQTSNWILLNPSSSKRESMGRIDVCLQKSVFRWKDCSWSFSVWKIHQKRLCHYRSRKNTHSKEVFMNF